MPNEIQAYEENEMVRYVIFSALSKTELTKVISLITSYEFWEKLRYIYKGNNIVKLSKKLTTMCRYENLKMEKREEITSSF